MPAELEARMAALRGGGHPLTQEKRQFFERRFGHDLSGVRIHSGPDARQLAKTLGAKGFAIGDHIAIASGEHTLNSPAQVRLLAHELAHVVQHEQNVIGLSWDDPAGPERARFGDLERRLEEHGFMFHEEGEYFIVSVPSIVAPSLGIHDLIPPPQRIHRSEILSDMVEWLPLTLQLEQESAVAGSAQGPSVGSILDAAFRFRFLSAAQEPLWVMQADDTYTSRVRLWTPVVELMNSVKQHLQKNCREWMSEHRTSPGWRPSASYPPDVDPHAWNDPTSGNPEAGIWAINPPGTDPQVNAEAYGNYLSSDRTPDTLWTSAIGSFGLYATVDSIDCDLGSAVLNVWMYNNMDQESSGNATWLSST